LKTAHNCQAFSQDRGQGKGALPSLANLVADVAQNVRPSYRVQFLRRYGHRQFLGEPRRELAPSNAVSEPFEAVAFKPSDDVDLAVPVVFKHLATLQL
jgi:hypothetical protein